MSDTPPLLSVIVVNVNTWNWLKPCLESLEKQDIFESLEVVVVDNGSTDGSADMVRRSFPACRLVRLDKTVGFGLANNIGVRHSTAPILLFLNPDTLLCENGLPVMLLRFEEYPRCGVAGGTIFDDEGELSRSVGSFPSLFSMGLGRLLRYLPPARPILGRLAHEHWVGYDEPHGVNWVTGAYLWIRREVFEEVGGFDEDIFMYCEDVDLCYRVRQLGFECWFFPEAPIVHYGKKAPVRRPRKKMLCEGLLHFANKHYRSPRYWVTRSVFWIMSRLADRA